MAADLILIVCEQANVPRRREGRRSLSLYCAHFSVSHVRALHRRSEKARDYLFPHTGCRRKRPFWGFADGTMNCFHSLGKGSVLTTHLNFRNPSLWNVCNK